MGTPEFAVEPLKALVDGGYNVAAVVTVPDKPAGRGLKLHESDVKRYAVSAGLPVLQPEKLKDETFLGQLRAINADLAIVVAFRMLPEVVWSMPRLGTFNLHASLLPQYRGAAPINWAVINGEQRTGVTTFMLNHRIDEGAILAQRETEIAPEDNVGAIYDKLMHTGAGLVIDTVEGLAKGSLTPQPQPNISAEELKPAPKIFKDTCRIDFSQKGKDIVNLIRGLSPYPAAWGRMINSTGNGTDVKILDAEHMTIVTDKHVGTIESDGKTFIRVACADGYVSVKELQVAGKKRMSVADLLRGFKDIEDFRFE